MFAETTDALSGAGAAKYMQLEQILAARVRSGAYDARGLPGERRLAAEFHVARVTVRSALSRLQDIGLVARQERRGTSALSDEGPRRRPRLLRELVDGFLDCGRIDQRRVLGFEHVRACDSVASALGLAVGAKVLRVVRLRSIDAQPLTFTEVFVPENIGRYVSRDALERQPYIKVLEANGIKLGDVEQSFAAETAPDQIAQRLALPAQAPILRLRRLVFDAGGDPVQLLTGWYRADYFDVSMRLNREEDVTQVRVRSRKP